jgi:hypothetical protein
MQLHIQRILVNIVRFRGEVLTAVLRLRERGYSEAYLQTMMRALLDYICDVDGVKLFRKRK